MAFPPQFQQNAQQSSPAGQMVQALAATRGKKKKKKPIAKAAGKTPNNFIQGAIKKPGALHAQLGVPQGQKIPPGRINAAANKGGKLGQRARLAQTLKGLNKGY